MEIIILTIYLVGSVLAYGRAYGAYTDRTFALTNAIFSWVGFGIGVIYYSIGDFGIYDESRFLRFK